MTRSRRWARALGLLLAGALLSSCASIPSSGPVVAGRAVNAQTQEGLQVIAVGPATGDSPLAIVHGFLLAAADFTDDHQVARSFLTPQRRLAWRPDASVAIYPSESSPRLTEQALPNPVGPTPVAAAANAAGINGAPNPPQTARITVRTPVQATIDVDGRYQSAPAGGTSTATFTLTKLSGQWRISALADGILIPALEFAVIYRPFSVYFTDPAGRYLVPELHWFATSDLTELPTDLVRSLLDGPPAWLRGAVDTWAPEGTSMAVAAVVVAGDVATVDLTDQVRKATARQRQLLVSQLEATLEQLSTVAAVQITFGRGVTLDVPSGSGSGASSDPSDASSEPSVDPGVDSSPVVIDDKGRLARLDGRSLQLVKGVSGLSSVAGANRPAVASDSSSAYAVLNGDRDKLLLQLPGTKMVTLVRAPHLTAPSFDPAGWLWTAAGDTDVVYAAGIDSQTVRLRAPWLKHLQIRSLRISRDGTRAVLTVQDHGQGRVLLTGVVRDGQQRPVSLTAPISLVPDLTDIEDAAWVDQNDVVVLAQRSTDHSPRPLVVQIGGPVQASAEVPGAQSVASGYGNLALMVGTSHGTQARSGAIWDKVSTARWPAFPG